jgi:hypothetical protein
MKIAYWQRIAAENNGPEWHGDLDDDCSADWAGLLLRAEWMEDDYWWWAVTDKESGVEIASSNRFPVAFTSGEQSRREAENAARLYLNVPIR